MDLETAVFRSDSPLRVRCGTQIRLWGFDFDAGVLCWCSNGPAAESGERYLGNVGLTQIVTIIDAAQHSLRTLTFKISPPVLHDLGFKAALDWLVEHCKELYGLNVSFEGDVRLDPIDERMSVVLFRSIRELLINVAKHAQTAEAKLTCHCRNGALEVIVSDEGTGFDDDAETSGDGTKGFGLFSIRERLGYLGGTMQIRTAPGSGTSVVLQVSMSGEAERQEANPA